MIAALVLAALVLLGVVVAACTTSDRSRTATVTRRRSYVAGRPERVSSVDILEVLRGEGIGTAQARLVVGKAAERAISPLTMWRWLEMHDARSLSIVLAADLSSEELVDHLCRGTLPDLAELAVFAALNGLESSTPVARTTRGPVRSARVQLTGPALPTVFEPGDWAAVETTTHDSEADHHRTALTGSIEDRRLDRTHRTGRVTAVRPTLGDPHLGGGLAA